ncbi:MAG: hypothetical protein ACM3H8_02105 [Sphingobacteriales bacterium]
MLKPGRTPFGDGKAGLLGKSTIGIDGSKFKAVNSKKNNYNQKKIDKHRQFITDKAEKYLQKLDELDKQESAGDELQVIYIRPYPL